MLHEIFKGMDNASEAINDNFLNGSIVGHNLDADNPKNGYYVRFGNGFQVCWIQKIDLTFEASSFLSAHWNFPAPFADTNYLVLPVRTAQQGNSNNRRSVITGNETSTVRATLRAYRPDLGKYETSDTSEAGAAAIGRWK